MEGQMCNAEDVFDITRHYADIKKGKTVLATVHLELLLGVGGGKTTADVALCPLSAGQRRP